MGNIEEIRDFIKDNFMIGMEGTALSDTDSLLDKGIIDSTGILELAVYLEETFGVEIEDEEMVPENLDSIIKIIKYVERKIA